jgi:hypothetical protein
MRGLPPIFYLLFFIFYLIAGCDNSGPSASSDVPGTSDENKKNNAPGKAITAFSFESPAAVGTIGEAEIAVAVPPFTPLEGLIPTITVSPGAQVEPPSGEARDFSVPVTYTVTAKDGSTAEYTVTVRGVWVDVAGAASYLADPTGGEEGTVDDPIPLPVGLFLDDADGNGWGDLLEAIQESAKYVKLDLSACTMSVNAKGVREFDPGAADTGEAYISSLTLPDAAESIKAGTTPAAGPGALFRYFTALKEIRGENIVTVGEFAFNAATFSVKNTTLTTVEFPGAQTIGRYAFAYCTALSTLSIESLITLEYTVFRGCTALQAVNLPNAEQIGNEAFRNCTALQTLFVPKAVHLGTCLFEGTGGQKALTLTLGSPAPSLGGGAGTGMFGTPAAIVSETVYGKSVTIKIPTGAEGYDDTWKNKFKIGLSGSTPAYEEYVTEHTGPLEE